MFQNLKTKNIRESKWHDRLPAGSYPSQGFHKSPSVTSYTIKGNEASRMVNCRICGFPCDLERDSKAKEGSWAGLGINQGEQLSAGTSIGDRRIPAAGDISTKVDTYYDRTITGGCPCCGSLLYWT